MILLQIERQRHPPEFGEVEYYFQMPTTNEIKTVAAVSMYSQPNPNLRTLSYNTLLSCTKLRMKIVDVKDITAVVAMVLHHPVIPGNETEDGFFIVEKIGLEIAELGGFSERLSE
jgi:hypothetical protein